MQVERLDIPDVVVVTPRRFADDRGFFSEVYNERAFAEAGIDQAFVQDNHSYSASVGTVRGLHYQSPPYGQGKLVRVNSGAIIDVVVDVRRGSPHFGQHVKAEISAENGSQIWVPEGFLHGFVTLEPNTHVTYKVTNFYNGTSDGAVYWADKTLGIDWGIAESDGVLSKKDAAAGSWGDFKTPFHYST
jgi:dTDP-4-dehydrorhamnose 3,5-epimerase